MSRIGKKPIKLEGGAAVTLAGRTVTVSGTKGKLTLELPPGINLDVKDGSACLGMEGEEKQTKMYLGLARSLIQGMVIGVTAGYKKDLEIQGVGFRGTLQGTKLTLSLGFSHPVIFEVPAGIKLTMPDQTHISIEGTDKQLVGETAARIRRFHPPDSYKGKGVRHAGEQVTLKEGKTVG